MSFLVPLRYRRSLASRVTLLTTIAVGLAVTGVAFAAYATVRMQSLDSLDESLRQRAAGVAHIDTLQALQQQQVPTWALGAADVKILFLNTTSGSVSENGGQSNTADRYTPEAQVALGKASWSARTVMIEKQRYRVVAVPAQPGQALILAQSLQPTDRMLDRLGLVMLLFGFAGMVTAGLAGWAVARNGLRPVRRLTTAVEQIARTERLNPISIEGNDEVARLAVAFNSMLTALSASQTRQRQLVADAGHELRTPLTSLRTNLDLLAQADTSAHLSPEMRQELLSDVRAQIAEMTTLIGDLTELAREDPATPAVEAVELAAVVSQAVTRVRRRTTTVGFEVRTQPWWVTGDAAALERAVTNLLDNAAKWSPEGGTVTVEMDHGTVIVTDDGPGISAADLPHVFERFYRSAESRTMPGSGLGLSIVRAVADRHGGTVTAGSGPDGGAAFWLSVPGTMAPPESAAQVLARP
ncbi:two-component system, OmpR family, sensor histidine kinase MprB [Nocardioides scoriae]|uniref:histidine kinase n=1 Tax=Nocardioides scoriae TaxID=642780 RepID=A0A1H1WAC8_9ACTN|nr:HAMP domain-containing sensor histidine kinase [Nocardioides scoriae]SDS94207.1 two-component system, OmpR family, sensor histidine kinase MprB [Nocardioides scoriae]